MGLFDFLRRDKSKADGIEERMNNERVVHVIFMAMLRIKYINEADYHKTIVDEFDYFENHHKLLLIEHSKPNYEYNKQKAINYYTNEYKDVPKQYQIDYISNPLSVDLECFNRKCFEDCYLRFYENWNLQLAQYIQKAAKRKRLVYLLEHTDIFIQIAKELENNKVIELANKAKSEYSNLLNSQ